MLPLHLVQSLRRLDRRVELVVYSSTEMLDFVKRLADATDKIVYRFVDEPEPTLKLPAIGFQSVRIFFHTVPDRLELESFLAAVKAVSRLGSNRTDAADLLAITFVSKYCPNCRATVDALNNLAIKRGIEHHVVDVGMFPEIAEKFKVTSLPTAFIGDLRFVGAMSEDEAEMWVEAALKGDYYEYFASRLMRGDIETVKEIAAKKKMGRVLAELMAHREFMVRLGAMAAIEALASENKEIADQAKEVVIELLDHEDERIREDAAMMLGIIGGRDDVEVLSKLAKKGGRVGDSAEEAIENIRGREENG